MTFEHLCVQTYIRLQERQLIIEAVLQGNRFLDLEMESTFVSIASSVPDLTGRDDMEGANLQIIPSPSVYQG
jgi:hypothetical protein